MTREDAWTMFAAHALAQCMVGYGSADRPSRAELAAKWADSMMVEWVKRQATESIEKPARKRG